MQVSNIRLAWRLFLEAAACDHCEDCTQAPCPLASLAIACQTYQEHVDAEISVAGTLLTPAELEALTSLGCREAGTCRFAQELLGEKHSGPRWFHLCSGTGNDCIYQPSQAL